MNEEYAEIMRAFDQLLALKKPGLMLDITRKVTTQPEINQRKIDASAARFLRGETGPLEWVFCKNCQEHKPHVYTDKGWLCQGEPND